MLKKVKEAVDKTEEVVNDIEDHKFEILAGFTVGAVLCIACYLAGFKDGSRHFFML